MDYKIVKECRLCRKRFNVSREGRRRIYCDDCEKKQAI